MRGVETCVMKLSLLFSVALFCGACSITSDERHAGTGSIQGTVEGLELATNQGVSITRFSPPTIEIKISPGGVACETVQGGHRITIDTGDDKPGTYTVVRGFPNKALLSAAQARAHVCPATDGQTPPACHESVRSGTVVLTKVEKNFGGHVAGTYEIELADGSLSGSFDALNCNGTE